MNIKRIFLGTLLLVVLITVTSNAFAQQNFIGKWQSKEIKEDTETLVMEYIFKDSTRMEMAFITDNQIPNVGRCISRISVQGTYQVVGPILFTKIDQKTLNVSIIKLTLTGEFEKNTPIEMLPTLKNYLTKQMELTASTMFAPFDGASMIYATHEGTEDVVTFIIGDSENAMDIEFARKK